MAIARYYLLYALHTGFLFSALISKEYGEIFNAAFVIPTVSISNKEYIIVGREAGGRDAGTYCIPGGSNHGWFWKEKDPLITASRELIEELLLGWSHEYAYNQVKDIESSKQKIVINGKHIIVYKLSLSEKEKATIIDHYYTKRSSYPFWYFSYREMDRIALIEKDELLKTLHNCENISQCKCLALVRNPYSGKDEHLFVVIRPVLAHIMMQYNLKNTNVPQTYT